VRVAAVRHDSNDTCRAFRRLGRIQRPLDAIFEKSKWKNQVKSLFSSAPVLINAICIGTNERISEVLREMMPDRVRFMA
jgi:hypothetical protein